MNLFNISRTQKMLICKPHLWFANITAIFNISLDILRIVEMTSGNQVQSDPAKVSEYGLAFLPLLLPHHERGAILCWPLLIAKSLRLADCDS